MRLHTIFLFLGAILIWVFATSVAITGINIPEKSAARSLQLSVDLNNGVFKKGDNPSILLNKYPELSIIDNGSTVWYSYKLLNAQESISIKAVGERLVYANHRTSTHNKSFFGPKTSKSGQIRVAEAKLRKMNRESDNQADADLRKLITEVENNKESASK